jgi:hypothetical protein
MNTNDMSLCWFIRAMIAEIKIKHFADGGDKDTLIHTLAANEISIIGDRVMVSDLFAEKAHQKFLEQQNKKEEHDSLFYK